jgi:hypothetical protein
LELWADALAGIIGVGPTEVRGYHARLARLKGADKIKPPRPEQRRLRRGQTVAQVTFVASRGEVGKGC